jgi:hypothetical protein
VILVKKAKHADDAQKTLTERVTVKIFLSVFHEVVSLLTPYNIAKAKILHRGNPSSEDPRKQRAEDWLEPQLSLCCELELVSVDNSFSLCGPQVPLCKRTRLSAFKV